MNNSPESRAAAIQTAIVEQVHNLIESNYDAVVKSAEETFKQEDDLGEITAKIAFAVTFLPAIANPKVTVKASWSVKFSDESEVEVDPEQSKLELQMDASGAIVPRVKISDLAGALVGTEKVQDIAARILSSSPKVKAAALHLVDTIAAGNKHTAK